MTAEIVIMNKRGVVASADSAATVGNKTFNSANKLFQLIKGKPIGILIFNNSEINGIPVEIIIKEYSKKNAATSHETLKDCVTDFKDFLKEFIKQHIGTWDTMAAAFYDFLVISNGLKDIDFIKDHLQNVPNIINIRRTKRMKADVEKYLKTYAPLFDNSILVDNLDINKIIDIFLMFVNRGDFSASFTGFSIFGYGDKDIYPKTYVFHSVGFVTSNTFKIFSEKAHEAEQDIIQLAQRDMSDMFIFGLPGRLKNAIKTIYNGVVAKLFLSIGGDNPDTKHVIEEALAQCAVEVDKTITGGRLANLQQSLPHLSLKDLSDLSETLISLECLKNRASLDIESVGGEVTTAIISKYEGFRWKKSQNSI